MPSAAGRARMNQGETSALTADALMVPQPAPLSSVTAISCQGSVTTDQPKMPTTSASEPALVTAGGPKRR